MDELERLSRNLTLDQFEKGRDLFSAAKVNGISNAKAAGMCYRAGYIEGKKAEKQRSNDAHRRLHEYMATHPNNIEEASPVEEVPPILDADNALNFLYEETVIAEEQEDGEND